MINIQKLHFIRLSTLEMPKSFKTKSNTSKKCYVVRDIIDYRVQDDKQQFLIYWKGYPKYQSTWETLENLQIKKGMFQDVIQQWREAYGSVKVGNIKMSQHQIEEYSKLNEIRICENNKKSNDSIWLKLTEYLLKQSNLYLNSGENVNPTIQIQKTISLDNKQAEGKFQIEAKPQIQNIMSIYDEVSKQNQNPQMLTLSKKNKIQKKKISKKCCFEKGKNLQKYSHHSKVIEKISSSFKKLPVNKILDKVIIRGQVMYELQLKYGQIHCESIYFHQNYVKNLWGELIDEFAQNQSNIKEYAGIEIQH